MRELNTTRLIGDYRTIIGAVLLLVLCLAPYQAKAITVTPRIELSGDPGQVISEIIKVQNDQRESKTYYISYANFRAVDESGAPTFSDRAEDLATWIQAPESIVVGPGDTKEIRVTITIPKDAEPGGHFAGLFLQTIPPAQAKTSNISISTKLGSLILLRVNGDFEQGADILQFGTSNNKRIFSSLPITFFFRFQNTGIDHLRPLGDIIITNTFGRPSKILPANVVDGSVLPKSIRKFESIWSNGGKPLTQAQLEKPLEVPRGYMAKAKYQWHNFAFGKYKATLKVVFGAKVLKSDHATYTFYVIPWELLSIVVPVGIVLLVLLYFIIKRYNRYIINKAQKNSRRNKK